MPGNHDVPLHNVAARFLQPLRGFRRYITDDLRPFYGDGEMAVLGVNTARSLTIKRGRLNEAQIAWMTGAALRMPTRRREDRRHAPSLRRAGRP